jgi:arylsulfatase A-like enzyme
MKRTILLVGLVLFSVPLAILHAADARKPNLIIIINIDDLGYADIGPFGSTPNRTPNLDWSAGEVLNALRTEGLAERTLVLFVSDNGGTPRAVNRPLRGNKGSAWEGGVRVPAIAWWPGKVPAGTSSDAICGMFDILTTFAGLSGGVVPGDRKLDGEDIRCVLMGDAGAEGPHETFYYYRSLQLEAVREKQWKLVLPTAAGIAGAKGKEKAAVSTRLFNLRTDIGESTDVAAQHPEIVTRQEALVARTKDDLGAGGLGPGCRPLGKVENPRPLIGHDGKVRAGFEPEPKQPNIILIMADDLGYETLGANGGTSYRTPQLDGLASGGIRFTNCFVQPLCTPTRVQIMTGRCNVRNYINVGHMDPQAVTFGNLLKTDPTSSMPTRWISSLARRTVRSFFTIP